MALCQFTNWRLAKMDAQVSNTVVWKQTLGMIPQKSVTFYREDAPVLVAGENMHHVYLRFKKEKDGSKNESMAVEVVKHDPDNFSGNEGHKFLSDLLKDTQRTILASCVDGDVLFDVANDPAKLMAWYYDDSRGSNGRKITKETIGAYVTEKFASFIITAALVKNAQMGTDTLKKVVENYADLFSKLTKFDLPNICSDAHVTIMQRIVDGCPECVEDELYVWIKDRLAKVAKAKSAQADLLDAI